MNVREFLKYLQNERIIPTGKKNLFGEIADIKHEPVSQLDMLNFIEETTHHEPERLRILRREVELYIQDQEFDARMKNDETKRKSNDEFFLQSRMFWNEQYKKGLDKLSDIGRLRVRVLQKWIAEEKVFDDELDLREQFSDEIVDVVAAKQAYDELIPGEGIYYPATNELYRFLRLIEYVIKKSADKGDKRKKYRDEILEEAKRYLSDNREVFREKYKGDRSPIVKKEIIPHLRDTFPGERLPSEPYLRNDVLKKSF